MAARTGSDPNGSGEPRPDKVAVVTEVRDRLSASNGALLTEYRGLKVSDLARLRQSLRDAGGEYGIYKNTLVRLAAVDLGLEDMVDLLVGPTAIAFVTGDPVAVAKSLRDFAKTNPNLTVKGGLLGTKVLSASEAAALADVAPREVVLAQLAGALAAPLMKMAGLLQALPRNFAYGLKALLDQKVASEPAAPEPAPATSAPETGAPETASATGTAATPDPPDTSATAETPTEPPDTSASADTPAATAETPAATAETPAATAETPAATAETPTDTANTAATTEDTADTADTAATGEAPADAADAATPAETPTDTTDVTDPATTEAPAPTDTTDVTDPATAPDPAAAAPDSSSDPTTTTEETQES